MAKYSCDKHVHSCWVLYVLLGALPEKALYSMNSFFMEVRAQWQKLTNQKNDNTV